MDQSTLKYYSDNAAQVAERYESVVSDLSAHFADAFSKGGKILDVGCGSGRDLAVLHKLGYDCYGVDPVLDFVEIAQQIHPELENRIALGKLPDLQVPFNGNFDGVLCSAVLMHIDIEKLPDTVKAIKSCLKLGGRLLYSVPSKRTDVVESNRTNSDSMGRDSVEWVSVLLELQTA